MATYAIGDVHGCYDELMTLLEQSPFEPHKDTLWFAGDIINRGPKSLETLRYIKGLGTKAVVVLGNHDLHLLALAHQIKKPKGSDTAIQIFDAPDKQELLDWLRQQPLLHYDKTLNYVMVHAGIPPIWSVETALMLASEVTAALRGPNYTQFLSNMYGNSPDIWHDDLTGWPRLRIITNYLTRMRCCDAQGKLELLHNNGPDQAPLGYKPWFSHLKPQSNNSNIIFGHWAALNGSSNKQHIIALDTGCVWGKKLTMMRLQDQQIFSCQCKGIL